MYIVTGTINVCFSELTNILRNILPPDLVRVKYRVFGEEVTYQDSKMEVYIYSLDLKGRYPNSIDDYQIECKMSLTKVEVMEFVENLGVAIKDGGGVFEIEKCDEDGKLIGEEQCVRFDSPYWKL